MSFRENLQHLRATHNMTQEQLAMLVGVSRQSVTKWEAERAYPEMDKLQKLCQIFDCTLDDLVTGDLTTREPLPARTAATSADPQDLFGYDDLMRRYARDLALGIAFIILGCAGAQLLEGTAPARLADPDAFMVVPIVTGVVAGLALILPAATARRGFREAHPFIEDFYTADEKLQARLLRTRLLVAGIGIILFGMIPSALLDTTQMDGFFLTCVSVGVGLIVYGSGMAGRTDVGEYNDDSADDLDEQALVEQYGAEEAQRRIAARARRRRRGSVALIIIMVATIVGLVLLFAHFDYFWMAWAVGGLAIVVACAVMNLMEG